MKEKGMIQRLLSIALLAAMVLSLAPGAGLSEQAKQYGYLVIKNDSKNRVVNFRRQANTNDNTNYPIARLPEYWVVEILGQEKSWWKISADINTEGKGAANYQTGYVMAGFVQPMSADEQAQWLAGGEKTFVPAGSAVPTAVPTQAPSGSPAGYLRTVQSGISLYETPAGTVIAEAGQIPLGQVLAYYAVTQHGEYDWALVQYNQKAGYIRSDVYIKTDSSGGQTAPTSIPAQQTVAPQATPGVVAEKTFGRVTADNVFFRKSMNTNGDFWARLPLGWTLEVLEIMDPKAHGGVTWYKVKGSIPSNLSRTYTGYIHGNFFALTQGTATPAPTSAPAAGKYGLVILDGINLRQTAGGTALTALRVNTVVNIISSPAGNTANDWYFVESGGVYGYLPATALRVLAESEWSSYVLPPAPGATALPTAVPSSGGYIKLVKDKVNIRKTPDGTVLTPKESDKMPIGTVLAYTQGPVRGGQYDWVLVKYKGIEGYVRGDCFVYCDAGGNPMAKPTAVPTAVPGAATPDPTNAPSAGQGYIKLIRGGVNLRQSIWGQTLGQLDRGTVLPYFNIKANPNNSSEIWYEVYSAQLGAFGFILGTMAQISDDQGGDATPVPGPTATPGPATGYVATSASSVWLRLTPAANGETAGQVKTKGTVLPLIGSPVKTDYTWYPVQTADGTRAYLRGDFVFELADWQLDAYNKTGAVPTPTPGPATPRPGNSTYIQVMGGSLWVRETPSRQAGTVGKLADGAITRYSQKKNVANVTWYQVAVSGKAGWVMGTYVRVLTNAEYDALIGTPSPVPVTPTSTPAAVDPTQFSDLIMTTAERVRIRANNSMTAKELIMVYQTGTVFSYLGSYTAPSQANPYYWYKVSYQGVTGWICGDFARVLTPAEKAAYQQSGNPDTPQPATYRTLSKNSTGEDVTRLQQKLAELGYLAADQVSGKYLASTENAVISFQRARGLTVDGVAGPKTQHALFGTVEPGTDVDQSGSSVKVTLYPVEKIDWYTGGIQSIWSVGTAAIITDVYTGISFRAQRLYGDNHADCEPQTTADTAAYCRIYGVSNPQEISDREQELQSYRRRPLWVTIGGRTFCASMYGIPHNFEGDRIPDNGYNGQFCVHFSNSKTHGSGKLPAQVDPDASYNNYFGHQSAIQYAYTHSISGTK